MKIYHHLLLLIALSAVNSIAFAQPSSSNRIVLKNGTFVPQKLTQSQLDLTLNHAVKTDGQRFAIFSFDKKLSSDQKASIRSEGILLLDYLSAGSYVVSITKELSLQRLRKMAVTAVSPIETHYKIAPQLLLSNQANDLEVLIAFHRSVNSDTVISSLVRNGYTIGKPDLLRYNMLILVVPPGKLFSLASMPFIGVIEKAPPPIEPLNYNSRNLSMAAVAQSSLPGGYNLSGEGVLVGIAEPASSIPSLHEDYAARIQAGPTGLTTSQHASHVLGTMAGAGNIQERYKGYAPKASIVTTSGQFQVSNSSDFFSLMQKKMVVSNNSYAVGSPCQSGYPAGTGLYDKTALDYPKFLEIYGAGNSGEIDCSASDYGYSTIYSGGFNTVISYANSAKNTLSVGAVYADGLVHPGSSRGPSGDGRLKPDITAMGINVASTIYETGYGLNTGTSMATPAVTGTVTLLNEYYRRLHNNELPNGSLLKAIVCNSATDYGNRGPDFLYGYGLLNVIRAVRTLENQWHVEDSVAEAQEKAISISVPAGTAQLKVMLYWHDQVMAPLASRALVNDLDISVTAPGGAVVFPYILSTDPAHTGDPAARGIDRLNNMEQVVVDDPVAGIYTITVRGTVLGMDDRQPFAVVYDLVKDEVEMAYPSSGDNIQPGETFFIQWYDKVQNTSAYTVEYSVDAGASWQLINNAVPATQRRLQWQAPGVASDKAQVRVKRNAGGTAASSSFVLLGVPGVSVSSIQCPSYFNLRWGQVPGSTDYEIFLLRDGQMQSQGTTTLLHYALAGLSPDTTYYAAVAARINGKRSLRSIAVSRMPNTGNCTGDFSDRDMSVDSLFLPVFARKGTSSAYSSQQQLKVRIRNFDDQPSGAFAIRYRVNNSAWITEQYPGAVSGNSSAVLTLSTPFDLSSTGIYDVVIAVTNTDDTNQFNDTLKRKLRQLENAPVSISPAFVDSFAQAEQKLYNASRLALDGMERYDYSSDHFAGRLSTGTAGLFASGRKEIYLTTQTSDRPSTAKFHRVIGTFNLSDYDTLRNDIGLTITYSKMTSPLGQEKLFVRGSDTSSWIEAYLFFSVAPSLNNKTVSVNLTDILRKGKQNFSSSAQLMISQQLSVIRFSVSAFRLFDASNDAELITADSLQLRSHPGSVKPLHVIVRNNSRNVMNNVPVAFRLNNTDPVTEVIPFIAPSSSVTYKFTTPLALERYGKHDLSVWVQYPGDSNPENDRKDSVLYHLPLVNSFPYTEDFEKGTGEWYVSGANTSFEHGTPVSAFINRAASGSKAFKTNLTGVYNSNETSLLSSPGFNLSGLKNPRMSISLAQDIDYCYAVEYCESLLFYHNLGGTGWPQLPFSTRGTYHWGTAWGDDGSKRWRVATTWLPALPTLGLRFQFRSDAIIQKEGIAIDNIHIYDSIGPVYGGGLPNVEVKQTLAPNNEWTHFIKDGLVIASINTEGQDLGDLTVSNYKHSAAPNFHGQYYLRRHFRFQSDKKPSAPVTVRVYYRDEDVDSLFYARNCTGCTSPVDAHRIGVSTYVSSVINEYNGQLQDNLQGVWDFIPYNTLKILPYEDGYYAEFKLTELGEIWLNDGGVDGKSSLPMQFTAFEVIQQDADNASLQWSSRTEINIHHFDIEVAKGNIAFQEDRYIKEAELPGKGRSAQTQSYNLAVQRSKQEGTHYYRIKAVDAFGNYSYSKVKPVVWSNELQWQVYPNPLTDGSCTLLYQASPVRPVKLAIFNSKGMLVRQWQINGNGFIQKELIPLNLPAAGVYMLRADTGEKQFSIKLIKQ